MPLLRYNLAPTLNGLITSHPTNTTPWIVPDPTIDFPSLYAEFSTFLLGRKTYETFLSMPPGDNPLLGRPKESVVVFTRDSVKAKEWEGDVTVVGSGSGLGSAGVVEFVRGLMGELKRKGPDGEGGKDVWLMGGGEVAGMLLRAGLVDVVEAAIMPVVVGQGAKMFGEGDGEGDKGEAGWKLVLEKAEALASGILMTRYRVVYD
ncbi:bifunctional deaminase-reductase domain protein [Parachaetomium inaequale]|uniref:2,5-diamino-6-ribosylamino-4(3H)-pyrimidinone 5'-phosphate reductase n=1 Tax=Parachaetomium inaequale TaxID=2588326 RepID=A0AAN6PEA5_9PEZI|nr:bifunctional deaminase-reductase domain protein [Parachaetomium inaequale]